MCKIISIKPLLSLNAHNFWGLICEVSPVEQPNTELTFLLPVCGWVLSWSLMCETDHQSFTIRKWADWLVGWLWVVYPALAHTFTHYFGYFCVPACLHYVRISFNFSINSLSHILKGLASRQSEFQTKWSLHKLNRTTIDLSWCWFHPQAWLNSVYHYWPNLVLIWNYTWIDSLFLIIVNKKMIYSYMYI